jgi:hypothetical protein
MTRRPAALAAAVAALALAAPGSAQAASTKPFRGAGAWVDIYEGGALSQPEAVVRRLAAAGVRTLYLETANWRRPRSVRIVWPNADRRFITAAHARGMKVVAWYLPSLADLTADRERSLAAIRFKTPNGQGFDGFALDIEADLVPPAQRIANFLHLSAMVCAAVGPRYALGAIIPSPRGLIRAPTYWPGFPYAQLPRYYDVILPMSYFTFRVHGAAAVGRYVRDNVEIIRRETGDPNVPVHVIGGIADDMTPDETRAFVVAAQQEHAFGASLYEFPRTSAEQWSALAPLR